MKEVLNKILMARVVRKNLKIIQKIIPEVKYMIGFPHKHPHHDLDVWEHTLAVIDNIEENDLELLMAALLHDIGKPFSYQDEEVRHFRGHQEVSYQMSRRILTRLKYDDTFIQNVCYLVKKHDTVIDPKNLDNSYEMVGKRLKLQYADAKAHKKITVPKRLEKLDQIKEKLEENKCN